MVFSGEGISKNAFPTKQLNSDLPADWSDYKYLIMEFQASSPQRFEVGLHTANGYLYKRIHPFAGALTRFVVTLDFYRAQPTKGNDMAATWNQPRTAGFMNVELGGFGPVGKIDSIAFRMITPLNNPTLQIHSLKLSMTDPGDSIINPKVLVDKFGQWIPDNWEGKAHSIEELKAAWSEEDKSLTPGDFKYGKFGGYLDTQVKSTGFFRVEKINERWWFVDPEGHLFLSTSSNGINPGTGTRTDKRESIFEELPPQNFRNERNNSHSVDFASWNLYRRYGDNWREEWKKTTIKRLNALGFTTASEELGKPFISFLRNIGIQSGIMGIPDVYSKAFAENVEKVAKQQCEKLKDNQWLIGYFLGNEQPWPKRESLAVDKILEGPDNDTRKALEAFLKEGDTPERRIEFCKNTFQKFLEITMGAIKKYDPNHMILGIRFGGTPPDYLIKMASVFDVYSLNTYAYKPSPDYLQKVATLSGRPILIGEYHFGTPGRGMSSGLCQVQDQSERGVAYQYYTENALSHPSVIGAHWFQWNDEPNTGRNDGENYNIGIVDVTDRPYKGLTDGIVKTHQNLFKIHSGESKPSDVMPQGRTKVDFEY